MMIKVTFRRPVTIISLCVSIFILTSLTSNKITSGSTFKGEVDSFLEKYSAGFSAIPERYNSFGNDYILDTKVMSSWKKIVTLKSKIKFENNYKQIVSQRLFLGFYKYENKVKCSAALDSLLACFGNDCAKIKWGEQVSSLKATPSIYIVNDSEIIVCHIRCEQINNSWEIFKDELIHTFGEENSGVIESGCGGPVEFRKIVK